MIHRVSILLIFLLLVALRPLRSQDLHEELPKKRVAIYLGHTLIPELSSEERFVIPSWGLDIDYWFNQDIGLGIHSDLELETFVVRGNQPEELERTYPLVLTLDGLYRPYQGLILQAGPGVEIDPEKSFFLARLGVEYEIQLTHHWDLSPTIFYDHRINNFGTWSIALGTGKRF